MANLYKFQVDSVARLLSGKHFIISGTGSGKTAMAMVWAREMARITKKKEVLVITTASKSKTTDFQDEAKTWGMKLPMEIVSWHMVKKWCNNKTPEEIGKYLIVFDEVQRAKQGVSSLMGKSFLLLTKHCDTWSAFTATPGDNWIDFYPYFVATDKVRHKTDFQNNFCIMQHYPYPMVLSYRNQKQLREWWGDISYTPDTSEVMSQLPRETHQVITLPPPKGYKKVLRTSTTLDGEFLDSNMALLHELRQMCATPDKLSALSELLESLSSPLVVFYNYTQERTQILGLAEKLGRKVWRIDGERHEIPTAETIGENDIVLCHYLSGSEALNLQFCNYWLSYSYNYSYSTTLQAKGRIRRIGQTKPQFYYWLRCKDTVEMDIAKVLHNKRDFSEENWSPERSKK